MMEPERSEEACGEAAVHKSVFHGNHDAAASDLFLHTSGEHCLRCPLMPCLSAQRG